MALEDVEAISIDSKVVDMMLSFQPLSLSAIDRIIEVRQKAMETIEQRHLNLKSLKNLTIK